MQAHLRPQPTPQETEAGTRSARPPHCGNEARTVKGLILPVIGSRLLWTIGGGGAGSGVHEFEQRGLYSSGLVPETGSDESSQLPTFLKLGQLVLQSWRGTWVVPQHPAGSFLSICSPCSLFQASLVAQTVKNLPARLETWVRSLGQGRAPGEGNGNPLCYSCLENPMARGAWRATVHGVTRSRSGLTAVLFSACSVLFLHSA